MAQMQHTFGEQSHGLTSVIPLHLLVPAIIGLLTLLAVGVLLQKAGDKDIYEPREKHVIKVEEVRSPRPFLYLTRLSNPLSYGITLSKDSEVFNSTPAPLVVKVSKMIAHSA